MAADNYWPAVVSNLARVRGVWKRMTKILGKEGGGAAVFRDDI